MNKFTARRSACAELNCLDRVSTNFFKRNKQFEFSQLIETVMKFTGGNDG